MTQSGNQLVSDRHRVSASAFNVWKYYFKNRGDVNKTPLAPPNWYDGPEWFDQTKFSSPDPKTWPPTTDDSWILQSGYTKSPSDINNPNMVQKFAKGGAASDTVPAMLTPGEFVINKKAAQSIGYTKLARMNHADKVQGFARGGAVGGVKEFASGGAVGGIQYFLTGGEAEALMADAAQKAGVSLEKFRAQIAASIAAEAKNTRGTSRCEGKF